jgi:hypothetical protein
MTKRELRIACLVLIVGCLCQTVSGQSTEFTYQGRLLSGGLPASGSHDFEFRLFRDSNGNQPVGTPRTLTDVNVNNGVFSVRLDFGDEFPGENRYLEIRVRQAGQQFFTVLAPLQAITSAPYAIKSLNAENANNATNSTNATQLGGVDATQYVLTADSRMSDARTPLPNSANYIQNSTAQQASSNFNIAGTGTANILNAATRFDIGGNRVLSNPGTNNLFAGVSAGLNNTGTSNSFFGASAGTANTSANDNSFFGARAGQLNTSGNGNSFFGSEAGEANTTASNNSFFGLRTGINNQTGSSNSFFGSLAGLNNNSGFNNAFFGKSAGQSNNGSNNSFFGTEAGLSNTSGLGNSFFGQQAGRSTTSGGFNSFFGESTGLQNTTGTNNVFIGSGAGVSNSAGNSNAFVGDGAGDQNTTGNGNTLIGAGANVGFGNLSRATAIGSGAIVSSSDTVVLGRSVDSVLVPGNLTVNGTLNASGNVGIGTSTPTARLTISGSGAFNAANAARFDLFNTTANAGYFLHVLNDGRWQLGSGNQTRILVDTAGNVGIGIGPSSKLTADGEISSVGATGGRFAANNPNNQNARVLFDWINDGTTDWPRIRYGGNGSGSANGFLIQGPGDSTKLTILDTGKVNIPASLSVGTTATVHLGNSGCTGTPGSVPGSAIGLNGVSCSNYSLGGDGSNTFIKAPTGAISFLAGGTESIRVASNGRVAINSVGTGGSTNLCLNSSNQISSCSSSVRYKNNIHPFIPGLNLIKRLRPVSFKWKSDGSLDFGLVAEEIAELEPLLVSRNRDGAIEGVKYDRVGVVLVNAVQEQQQQIDKQKKEIQGQNDLIKSQTMQIHELGKQLREQTNLVESLRRLFCESHPQKDVCRR